MHTDAVILAGGRASEPMAERTGTPLRALFEYRATPFVQWAYDALRASGRVGRIAVIGPPELRDLRGLSDADLLLPERDSIQANLFAGLDGLQPQQAVLITACDNPLLSAAAFAEFLDRVPPDADAAYPILPHSRFLDRFPGATNVAIRLRDGAWIGGDCVYLRASAIEPLRRAVEDVLAARKSLWRMLRLLGPGFAAAFAMRRLTVGDVERQAARISRVRFRFVPDCDPAFAIDIDDPEDWDYLRDWDQRAPR